MRPSGPGPVAGRTRPRPGFEVVADYRAVTPGYFDALGIDIAFTKVAVVLAVTFVASPFYLRSGFADGQRWLQWKP